ncbi:MAG: branched-chain amino acid transport system ATP-binding protein [Rhodobacteraceae bacterium HLUCCA12]|nr:MAG: branched-chain amino acid transport system ATP-binding protein [Rhodobacteraceae bacterium HLUCCA12]
MVNSARWGLMPRKLSNWTDPDRKGGSGMELEASQVTVRFGGIRAVEDVSLRLGRQEIIGLIGPNGAGKTTLVNALSGFQKPRSGQIRLAGDDVTGWSPDAMARHGVVRTFQAVRLFQGLTVAENVETALLSTGADRSAARAHARDILAYLHLSERADTPANGLNYGDERRVGIARALAMEPKFLLLDEPAAGLNIGEAQELGQTIARIPNDFGCGILVIEHNMALVRDLCERLHVLATGMTLVEGTPAEVMAEPAFINAYLGAEA